MTHLYNSLFNIIKNKVGVAFRGFPNLYPILEHKTSIPQDLVYLSKEPLVLVYNFETTWYEIHDLSKPVGKTYQQTFPPHLTEITSGMLTHLFSLDQKRRLVSIKDGMALGRRLNEEKKMVRRRRAIKHFENTFIY